MPRKVKIALWIAGGVAAAAGVALYFVHPFAAVLWAGFWLVQLPVVWLVALSTRRSTKRQDTPQDKADEACTNDTKKAPDSCEARRK